MSLHFTARKGLACLFFALITSATVPAIAQTTGAWPTKPIKIIVGYSAGGATDVLTRLISVNMSNTLGQSIVVENRPGANSNVGAEIVARSPADGYTLYAFSIANTINASLYPKLSYDPIKDFEPVGMIAKIPNILVVNPNIPVKTVADYVRYAKDSKDGVTFASSGSGSSIHLSGEMFKMQSKVQMLHIPYKGSAPAVTDLLGGQVESMFDNAPSALPHIQSGKLRPIAVTSAQRSPYLPDVPTIAESGYPGFDVQSWFALVAPAGTPKPIIKQLNAALNKALNSPEVRQRLQELAATPEPGTPEKMAAFEAAEVKRWREVVKESGAKAE
ncbi:tripartite tricarboxylate transporter substrate binding protein [Polynucleobacter sp. MWH-Braz-FAM2G]|uniref:Bug family tripartite tricarboxylate transporter substrate binding protein n=1 Tax=Polynucleobacter sp. MWH-Braz-FAM2G TaxID=1855883 RepID=UPI001BFE72FC|nr:tripartite tricarboxylate transporter substrate binding protein [Polynucleobacter sp. MWH-Braz-FAM2G]QWD91677.1 tripartite tricarboxylate transporter substrate binding protein [Polynucleobacter sp. MWH-Braz-FAM2G]